MPKRLSVVRRQQQAWALKMNKHLRNHLPEPLRLRFIRGTADRMGNKGTISFTGRPPNPLRDAYFVEVSRTWSKDRVLAQVCLEVP